MNAASKFSLKIQGGLNIINKFFIKYNTKIFANYNIYIQLLKLYHLASSNTRSFPHTQHSQLSIFWWVNVSKCHVFSYCNVMLSMSPPLTCLRLRLDGPGRPPPYQVPRRRREILRK